MTCIRVEGWLEVGSDDPEKRACMNTCISCHCCTYGKLSVEGVTPARRAGHGCRPLCIVALGFCSFMGGALAPCIRVSLGVRRHDKPDLRAGLGDTRKNTLFTFFLVTSPVEKHVSHSYKLQVICPHDGTAALSGLRPDCSYLS